jgi:hypothetical protein
MRYVPFQWSAPLERHGGVQAARHGMLAGPRPTSDDLHLFRARVLYG